MSASFFLDTNIIIYAASENRSEYRAIAQELLSRAQPVPVISTQVLQETYVSAVKKLSMTPADAHRLVGQLLRLRVEVVSPKHVLKAIELTQVASLSFWDALIIAAAKASGCETLYTEDLNHGQLIDGVRIVNPFK